MSPIDPARYALFLGVMAVFAIIPGPANVFAIATGVRAGPRAALLGVLGMNAASLVWIAAAAAGLGALAQTFPGTFHLFAIAGALYVAWLAVKALWAAWTDTVAPLEAGKGASSASALRDGFAVQFSNPKAMIFFTAVLPPFLDPARPALLQLALFGATVIAIDLLVMSGYGLAGGALGAFLREGRARRAFSAIVGVLLAAAAAMIALR